MPQKIELIKPQCFSHFFDFFHKPLRAPERGIVRLVRIVRTKLVVVVKLNARLRKKLSKHSKYSCVQPSPPWSSSTLIGLRTRTSACVRTCTHTGFFCPDVVFLIHNRNYLDSACLNGCCLNGRRLRCIFCCGARFRAAFGRFCLFFYLLRASNKIGRASCRERVYGLV